MKLPTKLPRLLLFATAVAAVCGILVNAESIVIDDEAARGLQTTTARRMNDTSSRGNETETPSESPSSTTVLPLSNLSALTHLEMWQQRGTDMVLTLDDSRSTGLSPIPPPGIVAIAVSSDGSVVATGLTGEVRVYQYNSDTDDWIQMGQTLSLPVLYMAMASATGTRIALSSSRGTVQVYEYDGTGTTGSWKPMLPDVLVDEPSAQLALAMSADGSRLVKRGYLESPTRVYQFSANHNDWTQLGQDMTLAEDEFGDVDMSADGSTIAVGCPTRDASFVRVYRYDSDTNSWAPRGQDILGQFNSSQTGVSVALSGDGDKIVVGDPKADLSRGVVQVFEFNQATAQWVQMGNDMSQINPFTFESGIDVACSFNGNVVTYGAYGNGRENVPHIAAFAFDAVSDQWVQMGQALLRGDPQRGRVSVYHVSVALALDGAVLVTGSIMERSDTLVEGDDSVFDGRVRVFTYGDTILSSSPSGLRFDDNVRRRHTNLCWPLFLWMLWLCL
eukprot:scaffold14974_cov195-Amphora_coffeaeformis.AAC.28